MKYSILYVEDDKIAREGFATYYRRKQYDVHVFEKADDALKALETLKPNVIISDQKLEGDALGWEFLKRSIALSPLSIRLILSGHSDAQMMLYSFNEGIVFDYLSKSSPIEELESKIAKACHFSELLNTKSITTRTPEELLMQIMMINKEAMALAEQIVEKELKISNLNKELSKLKK